jgi:serralysin
MQSFLQHPTAPTNTFLLGLLTDLQTPIPFKWTTNAPLQVFFDDTGPRPWTEAEKAAALSAFATWEKVTNINFVATANRAEADIIQNFTTSTEFLGQAGHGQGPGFGYEAAASRRMSC